MVSTAPSPRFFALASTGGYSHSAVIGCPGHEGCVSSVAASNAMTKSIRTAPLRVNSVQPLQDKPLDGIAAVCSARSAHLSGISATRVGTPHENTLNLPCPRCRRHASASKLLHALDVETKSTLVTDLCMMQFYCAPGLHHSVPEPC